VFFGHKEAGFLASLLMYPNLLTSFRQMAIETTIFTHELQRILAFNEQGIGLLSSFKEMYLYLFLFVEWMLQKTLFLTPNFLRYAEVYMYF
jgi:hypothetical protein